MDSSFLSQLKIRMGEMGARSIQVGITKETNVVRGKNLNQAQLARTHEFGAKVGTVTIPERSFLRSTFEKNKSAHTMIMARKVSQIAKGEVSTEQGFDDLGKIMSADVRNTIASGQFTPLSEATVRRKGSSHPLIETGSLWDSIHYEVKNE